MTTEAFVKAFRYRKGSILGLWRDVSRDAEPQGDCQSFGWSVLCLEAGGKLRALLAMLTFRAVIWRAYSPVNGAIPRHAVLWLRGKGYIDSTDRFWRPSPKPHRPVYPAGLPVLVALAFLISLSTSLRAAEVLRVGPDTYNAATRVIVVKAKGKLRSEIPVPRRAAKHCALANFTITSQSLDVLFRKARDATMAGDLTFHDARATALTLLARRVDILTLARISQHSDLRMLQRYYRESSAEIAGRI